jgi:hypothetical protein
LSQLFAAGTLLRSSVVPVLEERKRRHAYNPAACFPRPISTPKTPNHTHTLTSPQVKPRQGDALLFFSAHVNGTLDKHSLHGGCPVAGGTKWAMTKW